MAKRANRPGWQFRGRRVIPSCGMQVTGCRRSCRCVYGSRVVNR